MTELTFAELTADIWRKRQELEAMVTALAAKQITPNEFAPAFAQGHQELSHMVVELALFDTHAPYVVFDGGHL